ncbi:DUF3606 domain-containing protein [Chitinophaga pinensis]|uniref:DUF3606 domain-containing protein n=1 Tax=Chitinophaga pinensis (strain ATCC 43595 / DSM 2588 / LMG 13176 / NBRC 15968 / NCIMB 11800 / UQM 2034) TaxID=485918 RepID=A0A979G4V9_CHIPD|nr:DUF3606 domain-containing protein [Chitinophaga pinensis]ACU60707.1 conserved hypothetical protein [Chitinophaga pinensis DSM 2588]
MSDDKNIRDQRDRNRVSAEEGYELAYLEEKFNLTREQVKNAVKAVGSDRQKVEAYLAKQYNK